MSRSTWTWSPVEFFWPPMRVHQSLLPQKCYLSGQSQLAGAAVYAATRGPCTRPPFYPATDRWWAWARTPLCGCGTGAAGPGWLYTTATCIRCGVWRPTAWAWTLWPGVMTGRPGCGGQRWPTPCGSIADTRVTWTVSGRERGDFSCYR